MSKPYTSSTIVRMAIDTDVDAVTAGETTDLHLVARIEPRSQPVETARPPRSLILVVDASSSLAGVLLTHVVTTVGKLVDLLDDRDRVGMVAFSHRATKVAPLLPLSRENRRLLKQRSQRLKADGATNVEAGLRTALAMLGARDRHEHQRVIVLSDGGSDEGCSDPAGLAAIVEAAQPDVTVSALGFGPHHRQATLAAIASAGRGEYCYIDNPLACDYQLARTLGTLGDIVADGVTLTLQPHRDVEIADIISPQQTSFSSAGLRLAIDTVITGLPQCAIAKLSWSAPAEPGSWPIATATLAFRRAGSNAAERLVTPVELAVRRDPGKPDRDTQVRVLLAQAQRFRHSAMVQAQSGQCDAAAALMRQLLVDIQESPCYTAGDGLLSEIYEQLLDEIMVYERQPCREGYGAIRPLGLDAHPKPAWSAMTNPVRVHADAKPIIVPPSHWVRPAQLIALNGDYAGQQFPLAAEIALGRSSDCDIPLNDRGISRRHAQIVARHEGFVIVDLNSTNNTLVNGKRVRKARLLEHGDEIALHDLRFRYEEL